MFGNKENVNILTALLIAHGIKRAVVCPGSRNAPIVHNLNECGKISCYPVTDERSAGFFALGISLAYNEPIVVCVTSGTALLNLAPAVAEASYRHHGLIVISADRPSAWIGQLDGQTLNQQGAFGCFVSKCVNLPEPHNNEEKWLCNRLINEALISVRAHGKMSVHINVPISEPLFNFNEKQLPPERIIKVLHPKLDINAFNECVIKSLLAAKRPMIVVGQINEQSVEIEKALECIENRIAVISEPLSVGTERLVDLAIANIIEPDAYFPDFILYIGDTLVSKRIKAFLRKSYKTEIWAVSEDGEVHDTFMRQIGLIECEPNEAILSIAEAIKTEENIGNKDYYAKLWIKLINDTRKKVFAFTPSYSQLAAIKAFEQAISETDYKWQTHYANSNAIRMSCIYAKHYVWCNRGVNGIEGSLSVAAGFSVATNDIVFCIIGDLSFFYDQNALWNTNIRSNLRILLLNNHCGGIFYSLRGLQESKSFDKLVSACHNIDAKGICMQNNVEYNAAHNLNELNNGLKILTDKNANNPILLEVFTDPEEDKRVIKEFIEKIKES